MKTELTRETVCLPSEDVVAREIEGDIIIVPLVAGIGDADDELYTLNETGRAVWKKLDGRRNLGQVTSALVKEFSSSPDKIQADVLGFAAEMIKRKILVIKE
ncbi:MAG: PqqD family protein [Candidatus Aminicenantes bacterium]